MSDTENFYSREIGIGRCTIRSGRANAVNTGIEDFHVHCSDSRQMLSFTSTGKNKGGFTLTTPKRLFIEGGEDLKPKEGGKLPDQIGFSLIQDNGDIIISAENGRIKLMADSIEMVTKSCDEEYGNIHLDAQRTLQIKAHDLAVDVSNETRINSTNFFGVTTLKMTFASVFFKGLSAVTINENPEKWEDKSILDL